MKSSIVKSVIDFINSRKFNDALKLISSFRLQYPVTSCVFFEIIISRTGPIDKFQNIQNQYDHFIRKMTDEEYGHFLSIRLGIEKQFIR